MNVRHGERGIAAVELPLVIGLVLIPLGLLVLHVPVWIEHQHIAREAAAEAARSIATATSGDAGAEARHVVDLVAASHGLDREALRLRIEAGAEDVTARVTVRIPGARLPGLRSVTAVDWTATHRERLPDLGERER